jgi:hypothetical protein
MVPVSAEDLKARELENKFLSSEKVQSRVMETATSAAAGAIAGSAGAMLTGVSSVAFSAALPVIGAAAGVLLVSAFLNDIWKSHKL